MVQLYPNLKLSPNQPSNNRDIHGVAGVKLKMNNTVCSIFQTVKREKTSVPKKKTLFTEFLLLNKFYWLWRHPNLL